MSKDRIKELENKINAARIDYYNATQASYTAIPPRFQTKVSDAVYDAWVDELSSLDPKNLAVIGIGSEPTSEWKKYTHKVPMGSLNKVQTEVEYRKWHDKYIGSAKAFLTLKLDGLSVSLIYENGILVKAATRGSGVAGELITVNVARMLGVPLRLSVKDDMTIRGEIILSKGNHKKFFQEYSAPRNAASGIARRYDGDGSDKLNVIVYELDSDQFLLKTYEDMFKYLQTLGFQVPTFYLLSSAKEVVDYRTKYQNKLRDEYDFELDGLVIHTNDLAKHNSFGSHNSRPYASIAYKFNSLAKEGYIADIEIQVGNSGRITPVAVFNPKVSLLGAEVEKASLHNFSNIMELGVGIGATVLVCRSNDVIPFIEEVIDPPAKIFTAPNNCPECDAKLINVGEYVQCPNVYSCPAQVNGKIINWVKELNILELGEKLIEKLVESKLVHTPDDLYKLSVDQLSNLDRMGKKSALNVYDSLWTVNPISLDIFLGGLSIPLIGSSTIRLLMESGYDSMDKIRALTLNQVESIKGIGPMRGQSLIKGLKNNEKIIDNLLANGIKIKEKVMGNLSGKSFVFTGKMEHKRNELEQMVSDAGGEVKSGVSSGLSFLVIADAETSMTSKAVKARQLGTKLISEDEFLEMLEKE
jgi:DNA ligase (NAD+)